MKPTVSRVMSFLLSLGVAEACVFLLSALAQDTNNLGTEDGTFTGFFNE